MSKINVNNIEANDASTDITVTTGGSQSLLVDTDGKLTVAGNLSVNGNNYPSAGPLSNRNLIINGAMQVAQRGTSATGMTSTAYRTVDRFKSIMKASGAGTWTQTQETDGPSDFSNSLKLECTTASSSLVSDAYFFLSQSVEAQDLQQLNYGSSGAKDLTLSFWVKSNKTGTYVFELQHQDTASNNQNSHQYTVNAAGAWEKKTITISGQTSNVINNDNGAGLNVYFWLLAGTEYSNGTYNEDTWHSTGANRAVGQVNLADTVGNYIQITGVQLEQGDSATPFEHRSYGDELARCQRYCQVLAPNTAYANYGFVGFCESSTRVKAMYSFPVEMRASPSFARTGSYMYDGATTNPTYSSFNNAALSAYSCRLEDNVTGGSTGQGVILLNLNDTTAKITFDAEL